jgi:glutamate-5-semialdehyde dehydrogenase
MNRVVESAKRARAAFRRLAQSSDGQRRAALLGIADEVRQHAGEILAANSEDVRAALPLLESGRITEALYRRLKLDKSKLDAVIAGVEQVAQMNDPVGAVTWAIELDAGLKLYRVTCPIGVIGVIFESRPDALIQIASLCLKSGNAVLLKGGSEAHHTNRGLFDLISSAATGAGLPADALTLLESREDVGAMLQAEGYVDLIVPRGSNELVRHIQDNTKIPVLGHAEGLCHIYVDRAADISRAVDIILDAKVSYPSACNAVETVLVHKDVAVRLLPRLIEQLKLSRVEVRCDGRAQVDSGLEDLASATEEDWRTEYCDLILSIKTVDSIDEAIDHIEKYGSRHTDAIVTEDRQSWERFFAEVDSAGVYWNASTRFADGYRYGFGAEVGISTSKLHPRGPVGLEGLVCYKYKLVGEGHTVSQFDADGKSFTHKALRNNNS